MAMSEPVVLIEVQMPSVTSSIFIWPSIAAGQRDLRHPLVAVLVGVQGLDQEEPVILREQRRQLGRRVLPGGRRQLRSVDPVEPEPLGEGSGPVEPEVALHLGDEGVPVDQPHAARAGPQPTLAHHTILVCS
jgi:hypothetical protein